MMKTQPAVLAATLQNPVPAVLAATLQNPVPAVLIPAENHRRLD